MSFYQSCVLRSLYDSRLKYISVNTSLILAASRGVTNPQFACEVPEVYLSWHVNL